MIVKIGGCNGSGKTSMVRALFEKFHFSPVHVKGNSGKVREYVCIAPQGPIAKHFNRLVILGDYRNVCGGMDTISDKEVRLGMVRKYATKEHARTLVIYEGLITGKTFGAMGALSDATNKMIPWLYVFMGATFEQCVERVLARRKAAGNDAPFDPERTMRSTYKSCDTLLTKVSRWGYPVWVAPHGESPEALAGMLMKAALAVAANKKGGK